MLHGSHPFTATISLSLSLRELYTFILLQTHRLARTQRVATLSLGTWTRTIVMRTRRMHGFMCRSQASTAVCIPGDARSVVVPWRPDRTLVGHSKISDGKYSRLMDGRRLPAPAARGDKRLPMITVPVATAANGGEKRLQLMALPTRPKDRVAMPLATVKRVKDVPCVVTARPCDNPLSLLAPGNPSFQVVVMRVSIHCQGCAGKVKKLISKMDGVTSFSIELEAKRVTVRGHISPEYVLESISKVKKAEFWPSSAPAMADLKQEPAVFGVPHGIIAVAP